MFKCKIEDTELWLTNTEQVAQLALIIQRSHMNKMDPRETTDEAEAEALKITFK